MKKVLQLAHFVITLLTAMPLFAQSPEIGHALTDRETLPQLITQSTQWVIVSDFDDTLIQANVISTVNMLRKFLVGRDSFPHLIEVFQDLQKQEINESNRVQFYYVSNSYRFTYDGEAWLKSVKLPEGKVYQRVSWTQNTATFKEEMIDKIIQTELAEVKKSGRTVQFLFFGDNAERDLEIYEKIVKKYQLAGRASVFIRDVRADLVDHYLQNDKNTLETVIKDTSKGQLFFSEAELFVHPVLSSLISWETKRRFKDSLNQQNFIPSYMNSALNDRWMSQSCPPWKKDRYFCQRKAKKSLEQFWDKYFMQIWSYLHDQESSHIVKTLSLN